MPGISDNCYYCPWLRSAAGRQRGRYSPSNLHVSLSLLGWGVRGITDASRWSLSPPPRRPASGHLKCRNQTAQLFLGSLFEALPRQISIPKRPLRLILRIWASAATQWLSGTWQPSGASWCCWTAPQLKARTQEPPFFWAEPCPGA